MFVSSSGKTRIHDQAPELCAVLSQNGPELGGPIFFGAFQADTDIGMDDFSVL